MISDSLSTGEVRSVFVQTSSDGGLSAEQIADLCCRKLVHVSNDAPPEIRDQAIVFKVRVENLILGYIKEAMRQSEIVAFMLLLLVVTMISRIS